MLQVGVFCKSLTSQALLSVPNRTVAGYVATAGKPGTKISAGRVISFRLAQNVEHTHDLMGFNKGGKLIKQISNY